MVTSSRPGAKGNAWGIVLQGPLLNPDGMVCGAYLGDGTTGVVNERGVGTAENGLLLAIAHTDLMR